MKLNLDWNFLHFYLVSISRSTLNLMIYSMTFLMIISCRETEKSANGKEWVDMVYPLLDTENSRWFFFSSACRPFGMVNLSPDTEIDGAWGSGYRFNTDTVKGFSHIHAWQLSGLSVMPVILQGNSAEDIYSDYYSYFDHKKEEVLPGYHRVFLERFNVGAELTSTKRVGFHRYNFGKAKGAILINLGGQLGPSMIIDGSLKQISKNVLQGELTNAPTFRRPIPAKVFFRIELDCDIAEISSSEDKHQFLLELDNKLGEVKMKAAISYTSVDNAETNLNQELPHWNFEKVVEDSRSEWNDQLGRIKVYGGTIEQQQRFYTDLWHALQGRRIISDVNGYYPDNTGDNFKVKRLPLSENGKPLFDHFNSDSFWGAQWTINTLWQLVYPEIAESFVNSLLQYYRDGGLIPRGPSGGNYTYVMTGASSTPFIVGAYQKGIRDFNEEEAFEALKKNHLPGGIMANAGYEHNTSLGGGLDYYIKKGYVPYPIPEGKFGLHQDGASLTLEYSYQDWCLAQMAKSLGKKAEYEYFLSRSKNYQNVFDSSTNWVRPKDVDGIWLDPFDPYAHGLGFNESNGAQSTWFVPHDIVGLAELMGGKENAVNKLNRQFEQAAKIGFTAGTAHAQEEHPEYSRIPINYGNQPSIQTAFIFNHLGRPDLTQYWSRQVVRSVYEGVSTSRGYNGDEDQGLMGALSVLMKIGLFQMSGGTEANPIYEIGSPVFKKIEIELNPKYYGGDRFTLETKNNSDENVYVHSASFNGKRLRGYAIHHNEVVRGGTLRLEMAKSNK